MKSAVSKLGIISCIVIVFSGISFAADTSDREGIYTLGEVVVTAEKPEAAAASTIYSIKPRDIVDMGATTLTDVLELVPGVSIRVGGQGSPRVDIRGFKTRHVLLLLDGVPINDTYDGQFDPTVFPVEYIAEVKVITGGGSVLYGPGGNGGIINIITKKGAKGVQGLVGGEYGSEDAWLAKASIAGGTEKLDFFIGANRESKDAFPLSDEFKPTAEEDGDERENSDMERDSLFANLGYDFSERTHAGLTLNWYQGENGVPPAIDSDPDDPFNKSPKYVRVDDIEGFSAQLAFNHKMDNPFSFRGWLYRNQLDVLENRYDDATYTTQDSRRSYKNDTSTAITGISAQASYNSGELLSATLGFIAENHDWDASGFEIVAAANSGGGGGSGGGSGGGGGKSSVTEEPFKSDEDIDIQSVALEFEITPDANYGFVLGVSQHFLSGDGVDNETDTSFLLGGRYNFSDKTRLKASYAKKIRFPSLKQLYDAGYGNPDLESEKTYQFEIGVTHEFPADTLFSVSAYQNKVEDYIEKIDDNPYENIEEYLFRGVDVSLETRFVQNLMLRATYSFLDSKDKSSNTERDELQYRPEHKIVIEGNYTFSFGLMVHGDLMHVAGQYFYAENTSPMLKRELNDYTVVNAKISQGMLDDRMHLYVRVENLFDEDFEQSYDLPQAGRSLYGGVDFRF